MIRLKTNVMSNRFDYLGSNLIERWNVDILCIEYGDLDDNNTYDEYQLREQELLVCADDYMGNEMQ